MIKRKMKRKKKKLKEALRKSKMDDKQLEKALRVRDVGDSASGTPKSIGELFSIPTTSMDESVQPDITNDTLPTDDAIAQSVAHDTSTYGVAGIFSPLLLLFDIFALRIMPVLFLGMGVLATSIVY